ncbi:MAG TPA: hypothetical protein VEZ20_06235 [Allosphingosinicella sp.]|nr:hypothetical protein [Allosphingosinicella sp.]
MPLSLLAAAAFATQTHAPPLPAPRALTRQEARTAPVDVLARRLLGATGALMREVERPPPEPYPGDRWLRGLTFATAPRWSRRAGLCETDLFMLSFQPAGVAAAGSEPPVRVSDLGIVKRFRAIGEPGLGSDLATEEERMRFEPACAESGPVLGQNSGWFGGSAGMHGFTANDAAFAIRVYRQAIAGGASGALSPAGCTDDRSVGVPPICGNPAAALASLPPIAPFWFSIDPCTRREAALCVTAIIARNIDALGSQRQIRVTIRTDREATWPATPIAVASISLAAVTIVY